MELATSTTFDLTPYLQAEIETAAPVDETGAPGFVPAFYVNAGAGVTFRMRRKSPARCQWQLNGQPIDGGSGATLLLANVGATDAGTYSVAFDGAGQKSVETVATLTVVSAARLCQFSLRSQAVGGNENLVVGFFIGGAGTKRIQLEGPGSTEVVLADWGGQIIRTSDTTPRGGPMVAALESGGYSVLVSGAAGGEEPIILELQDLDLGISPTFLANVSGRARVEGSAGTLVIGFKIQGSTSATVLVRGIGPSLQTLFGVEGALADAQVVLRDAAGRPVSANRGWGGGRLLQAAFAQSGAFALPVDSCDSALLTTLPPGDYSAELRGVDGSAGVGLLEVFSVPAQ